MVEPKSRAGRRRVPIAAALRRVLTEHRANVEGDFVVGRDGGTSPFNDTSVVGRAVRLRLVIRSRAS
jgi:hypothetical protein